MLTADQKAILQAWVKEGAVFEEHWAFRPLALEAQAKYAAVGLWADPHPIAPWEWRAARREGTD